MQISLPRRSVDPGVHPHACIPAVPGRGSDGRADRDGEVTLRVKYVDGRSALALPLALSRSSKGHHENDTFQLYNQIGEACN
jgi:hypothetical protein